MAALFVPLTWLPVELARLAWSAALALVAVWLVWPPLRALPPRGRPWAAAACALFLPLTAEVTLGNLNLVTLALCVLAWRSRDRPRAAGGALALAVGLKALPLVLPLFFLAAGRARVALWAALAGITAILITLPWLADAWRDYVALLVAIAGAPATQALTLIPGIARGPAGRALLVVAAIAVTALAGLAAKRDAARGDLAYALALAAALLVAPGIWYPYLVFALPLLGWSLVAAARARHPVWLAVITMCWLGLNVPKREGGPDVAFVALLGLVATTLIAYSRSVYVSRYNSTTERGSTVI